MIVAGLFAIIIPPLAGIAATLLIGWLLVFCGGAHLVFAWHRRGIGGVLLDRLIAESAARGFRQMIAVIGDSAQTASIALHARCGFHRVGTFESVGFKFERWLDVVLMQRALGAGASTPPDKMQ